MRYLVAVAQNEFKIEMSKLLTLRIKMLSSLANQYYEAVEQFENDALEIGASVIDHSLFIKRITQLDDEFAKKEETFYEELRDLVRNQRKTLKSVEMIAQLDLAIAECKNKINLAVTAVRHDASILFPHAQEAGITGKPIARLEYLKELTFEKEIATLYEIINAK